MSSLVTYPMLKNQVARLESDLELLRQRQQRVVDVLAGMLHNVVEDSDLSAAAVDQAIDRLLNYMSIERDGIIDILEINDALPEGLLRREYDVEITLPVTFTVRVNARNEDDAEKVAMDEVECNGLDNYYLDYNVSYDAEYRVYEV